jgi:predicted component of type VI protein secretion system
MIVCKDGRYYIRDLGIVHTSRIKVDKQTEIQIQQDSLIDLGKVVHYHFDKVTHAKQPSQQPNGAFYIMRPSDEEYNVEDQPTEDPPTLRARPTWVSSDEDKNLIQKEIILEAFTQNYFSIGRSMKREVQIKLKAVSADHCNITYTEQKGWFISEKGKDKMSANGTFVFMKSARQNTEHEPSDLIPIHDGMILSFINYEIRVNLEKKDAKVIEQEN